MQILIVPTQQPAGIFHRTVVVIPAHDGRFGKHAAAEIGVAVTGLVQTGALLFTGAIHVERARGLLPVLQPGSPCQMRRTGTLEL